MGSLIGNLIEGLLKLLLAAVIAMGALGAALGLALLSPLWLIGKLFSDEDKNDDFDKPR